MSKEDTKSRNSEAEFASPDGDSMGIGYYVDGERVSPAEFGRRVAADAARTKAERNWGDD